MAMSGNTIDPVREEGILQRLIGAPLRFIRDWLEGFVALQGFDRAVALAGQAFTALIPLLIVYGAVMSNASGRDFADQIIHAFELKGTAAANIRQAFAPPTSVQSSVSIFGVFLLLFSALAFTRALQRLYQLAWEQTSLGVRAAKWGLIWLGIIVLWLTVRPILLGWSHGVLSLLLSIGLGALVWLITPYVLLGRRISWHRLAPTALLTGVGMTALALCSAIWMPHSVATSAAQFGTIGVAFALLGWLVGYGLVLVIAASGGRVIDERLASHRARSHSRGAAPIT
jgi:membrane protein